ncbi:hypothetical protein KSC_025520 [Ktedonobacter sp. SOSP1-52]|nr:hypothetical protein KSC_025520 [Ktedonobacter sp. SOSP1-52]
MMPRHIIRESPSSEHAWLRGTFSEKLSFYLINDRDFMIYVPDNPLFPVFDLFDYGIMASFL